MQGIVLGLYSAAAFVRILYLQNEFSSQYAETSTSTKAGSAGTI